MLPICSKPFSEIFITVTGDTYACCSACISQGNIFLDDPKKVWIEGFRDMRETIMTTLPEACRANCLQKNLGVGPKRD